MINILFLCASEYYFRKMSRVRFNSIEDLDKCENIDVKIWGPGFDGWDDKLDATNNLEKSFPDWKPAFVMAYKPLEILGFAGLPYSKVIRYNEMWDTKWTIKEIIESKSDLVICHHYNDYLRYVELFKNFKLREIKFEYIGHCAESTIFKPYEVEKSIDIMLVGALRDDIYPLRSKWQKLLPRFSKKYNVKLLQHPGYNVSDANTNKYLIEFAKEISKAKVVLSCSTYTNNRLGKYIEVPMCHTLMAADMFVAGPKNKATLLPSKYKTKVDEEDIIKEEELFNRYLIKSSKDMSQEQLYNNVVEVLEDKELYEYKMSAAKEIGHKYTQFYYGQQFTDATWRLWWAGM